MILPFRPFFNHLRGALRRSVPPSAAPEVRLPLAQPDAPLPAWVVNDPLVQKYRALLGALPWERFPERPTDRPWPGPRPAPRAPFAAAYLIKLHEGTRSMADLRTYLIEHPALVYWLGFRRVADPTAPHGLNLAATVPPRRQLSAVLRALPNPALQFLLSATVPLLQATLPSADQDAFGAVIAGDTQALLAWVKQNNPKERFLDGRLDKTRQPAGDPDCKLGVKSRPNRAAQQPDDTDAPAPTTEGTPIRQMQVGIDIFWGYASGLVVTRLPDTTEVVLAERTRPFNEDDVTHFFPLMAQVEQRLGRRPRDGIWDAAFDAHYVYGYFHAAGGTAYVPFNPGPRGAKRQFDPSGAPLCAAGLPMPRRFIYDDRTATVPHQREKCVCPLLYPQPSGADCPITDPHFAKGGCTTTLAVGPGARIRHQLDRESAVYKARYAQRSMVERINSQAEALGILRPKLRRGRAIANQNTLIYVLINLRALARLRAATPTATVRRAA